MSKVISAKHLGKHQTFDLEVDHPDHQFYLANGVLTSNSHAVSYAIDSYYCAWLLTYFEPEWCCAYLESTSNNTDKLSRAMKDIRSLGYSIGKLDINESVGHWTISSDNKTMVPSFLSCSGVGGVAIDEIIANRPYESIEQVLWNDDGTWKPSKFNKKALEALVKVGAFDSLDCVGEGKLFNSYHHMHEVVIENMDAIRKTSKKDPHIGRKTFYELARSLSSEVTEWSKKELVENRIDVLGTFDVLELVDPKVIALLEQRGVKCIDDWNGKDIYWFCVQKAEPKRTKAGKGYLKIEAVGPAGKTHRMNAWGWDGIRQFAPYAIVLAEVDHNDFGYSTTMWRCKELE